MEGNPSGWNLIGSRYRVIKQIAEKKSEGAPVEEVAEATAEAAPATEEAVPATEE